MSDDFDTRFRLAAFQYLDRLTLGQDDIAVRWSDLVRFEFEGERAHLIGQRGIWNPRQLRLPISLSTAPPSPGRPAPYDDEIRADGSIVYRYQGSDPQSRDNVALRETWRRKLPLIYFHGLAKGLYLAFWPVYVVGDDPERLSATVALDSQVLDGSIHEEHIGIPKEYRSTTARRRLHQSKFRMLVMKAYRTRCAMCNLGHEALLDAAHIVPDRSDEGIASLRNGLSLCKIHHAAFDQNIVGVDPRLTIHVRGDILEEIDGPMLQHGIQELDQRPLVVIPNRRADRPGADELERRFEEFRSAG